MVAPAAATSAAALEPAVTNSVLALTCSVPALRVNVVMDEFFPTFATLNVPPVMVRPALSRTLLTVFDTAEVMVMPVKLIMASSLTPGTAVRSQLATLLKSPLALASQLKVASRRLSSSSSRASRCRLAWTCAGRSVLVRRDRNRFHVIDFFSCSS